MYTVKSLKFLLISTPIVVVLLSFFACAGKRIDDPFWKSVVCYNKSSYKISVTSVIGIQTFTEGYGPQNLFVGNLKPTGYGAIKSLGFLSLNYPIQIKWVKGFLDNPNPDWPTDLKQEIRTVYGVEDNRTEFSEDMSLILVFNGTEWAAYYAPNSSLLKKDINSIIESYSK